MSVEEKRKAAEEIGTLGSCLIEGDPEQKARERKIKRRALVSSVVLQSVALMAIVLVPLLGHTERITYRILAPVPLYSHHAPKPIEHHVASTQPPPRSCAFCAPIRIPHGIVTVDHSSSNAASSTGGEIDLGEGSTAPDTRGLINILGNNAPVPPEDPNRNQKKRVVVGGSVQQARLTHRVEPIYPTLPKIIRKSGIVHLHAVIATDGTIESLQVIDGDPMFVKSALDAVGQWQYQPTTLNGQPVEVETIITVIYSLGQQ